MESVTPEQLIGVAVVIMILLGVYNTVMGAVKTHRAEVEYRGVPVKELSKRVAEIERFLASDKVKIERLEEQISDNMKENRLMMRMQLALVRHAIDGNNIEDLKDLREEVNGYLIDKIGR